MSSNSYVLAKWFGTRGRAERFDIFVLNRLTC
jgi:hypothetical protein